MEGKRDEFNSKDRSAASGGASRGQRVSFKDFDDDPPVAQSRCQFRPATRTAGRPSSPATPLEGQFYIAVKAAGIFCRMVVLRVFPSVPMYTLGPREEAEQAGLRPCKHYKTTNRRSLGELRTAGKLKTYRR